MEVIYRGEIPPEPTYQGTCSRCKSIIRAKMNELSPKSRGLNEIEYAGVCPVCFNRIDFTKVKT